MSARLEQLLAAATDIAEDEAIRTDEDVQTIRSLIEGTRLLIDMGEHLEKDPFLRGGWGGVHTERTKALLARRDALGEAPK